jgi:shikimate dehydrogenase
VPLTGVTGWPVGHSRSPALHAAAFADLGLEGWHSQLLPIPPQLFDETVRALPKAGFFGINVTIPHKLAAFELADSVSAAASACRAANTLTFRNGKIEADNTDVGAIESAARELSEGVSQPTALVLGAGGTARAALVALAAAGVADVHVWNRTSERAQALAEEFGATAVDHVAPATLLVNTTSVGLIDGLDDPFSELPLDATGLSGFAGVIDLVYRAGGGPIASAALRAGIPAVDGLELLVRQGARSIEVWTGRRPELEPLRQAVA